MHIAVLLFAALAGAATALLTFQYTRIDPTLKTEAGVKANREVGIYAVVAAFIGSGCLVGVTQILPTTAVAASLIFGTSVLATGLTAFIGSRSRRSRNLATD